MGQIALLMVQTRQMRAARALLGIDQRALAERRACRCQRMEASDGVVRGNVDSLMKLIGALDAAGIELIGEGAVSQGGGRGVRLKTMRPTSRPSARRDGLLAARAAADAAWRSR